MNLRYSQMRFLVKIKNNWKSMEFQRLKQKKSNNKNLWTQET